MYHLRKFLIQWTRNGSEIVNNRSINHRWQSFSILRHSRSSQILSDSFQILRVIFAILRDFPTTTQSRLQSVIQLKLKVDYFGFTTLWLLNCCLTENCSLSLICHAISFATFALQSTKKKKMDEKQQKKKRKKRKKKMKATVETNNYHGISCF